MRTEEGLSTREGAEDACYHCVTRVVERRLVFGDREKEKFIENLRLDGGAAALNENACPLGGSMVMPAFSATLQRPSPSKLHLTPTTLPPDLLGPDRTEEIGAKFEAHPLGFSPGGFCV